MIKSIPYSDKITDYKGVFRFIKTLPYRNSIEAFFYKRG